MKSMNLILGSIQNTVVLIIQQIKNKYFFLSTNKMYHILKLLNLFMLNNNN